MIVKNNHYYVSVNSTEYADLKIRLSKMLLHNPVIIRGHL